MEGPCLCPELGRSVLRLLIPGKTQHRELCVRSKKPRTAHSGSERTAASIGWLKVRGASFEWIPGRNLNRGQTPQCMSSKKTGWAIFGLEVTAASAVSIRRGTLIAGRLGTGSFPMLLNHSFAMETEQCGQE